MTKRHRTYPKSVRPGIPRLADLKDSWKRVPIGDLFDEHVRPLTLQDDVHYELVTVKRSRGGIEKRSSLLGRQIGVKSQFVLQSEDFLISKRQIVHGACAIVPKEFEGSIVSNEYSVLRCREDLDLEFLRYLTHTPYFQRTCFHSSIGVHVEKMIFKLPDWFKWKIDIPSLPEQKKIAAFLGAVDGKLAALREKEAALTRFKRGLMQALFSQTLRFTRDDGSNYPDWDEKRIGELGETISGLSGKSGEDFGDGLPYVTYKQIFDCSVVDLSKCGLVRVNPNESQNRLRRGDVLFTTSSETPNEVGFASVLLEDVSELYLNSFCFGLRPHSLESLNPSFARYLFRSPTYRKLVFPLAQGSTRFNLSKSNFIKLRLKLPHPEEQDKVARALTAMDARITAANDQIIQLGAFKKGLLQQMFV